MRRCVAPLLLALSACDPMTDPAPLRDFLDLRVQSASASNTWQLWPVLVLGRDRLALPAEARALASQGASSRYGLRLPSGSQGLLRVAVDAVDGRGCLRARGLGQVQLDGAAKELTVTLSDVGERCPSADYEGAKVYEEPIPASVRDMEWRSVFGLKNGLDVWAVGRRIKTQSGYLLRWSGVEWQEQQGVDQRALSSVWGRSEAELFVTQGEYVNGSTNPDLTGALWRWDPATRKLVAEPTTPTTLPGMLSLWGDERDVFAGGHGGLILRRDGTGSWVALPQSRVSAALSILAIWGCADAVWFAAGTPVKAGSMGAPTVELWRLDRQSQAFASEPAAFPLARVHTLWGRSCDDVYAAGGDLGRESAINFQVLRRTGGKWTNITDETDVPLRGIVYRLYGFGENEIWGGADDGLLRRSINGRSFPTLRRSEWGATLYGVWGSRRSDVWVVGHFIDTPETFLRVRAPE